MLLYIGIYQLVDCGTPFENYVHIKMSSFYIWNEQIVLSKNIDKLKTSIFVNKQNAKLLNIIPRISVIQCIVTSTCTDCIE
jgi:hypothetical protein